MALDTLISHFVNAHKTDVIGFYEGLSTDDSGAVDKMLGKVRKSQIVNDIATAVASSRESLKEFTDRLDALGPLGSIVKGLTEVAAGAMMWDGAAVLGTGILAFLGTELIVVIAFALMAIGVLTALGGVSDLIRHRLQDLALNLG